MKQLKVGFARVNINPELGAPIEGYYVPRFAKGFLDDLEAAALALTLGEKTVLLLSVDLCFLSQPLCEEICRRISEETGVAETDIFLSATHTHTGPVNHPNGTGGNLQDIPGYDDQLLRYVDFFSHRTVDAARLALADRKPATMGFGEARAPEKVAYIRRYRMKDGSIMTCPPIDDPNIDSPIGTLDQRVHVLRFDREGGVSVVLVNYGVHVDCIGGELISSDWCGWMRRTLEVALDGVQAMFFPGAQGDVGSTHVFPEGGDMNDTAISFDNEMKSPGMARFIGRALAGAVLQIYDKVEYTPVDRLETLRRVANIPANKATAEELALAHRYNALHEAGRDDEIPFTAMELTTVVAESARMCRLEHGPDTFHLPLMGVAIGAVALVGIPGEPFTQAGVEIKDTPGWRAILPCALTGGYAGYFPNREAYDEGGYEARSSSYAPGVAETLVADAKALLSQLQSECPLAKGRRV